MTDRLARQIDFLLELDRLKSVQRRTVLLDRSRRENSAEHSWHLALFALVLAEQANQPVDLAKVVVMALVHDIVEIDAGDTFIYDAAGAESKAARERAAAERIFGLLPDDQAAEFRAVWDEFEAAETPEARFARALDRLHPLLHNLETEGHAWREHGITRRQVIAANRPMADGAAELWAYAAARIEAAQAAGHLADEPPD